MGTRYYMIKKTCSCEGGEKKVLIGKAFGMCPFVFNVNSDLKTVNFVGWLEELTGRFVEIKDEYGNVMDLASFIRIVFDRKGYRFSPDCREKDYRTDGDGFVMSTYEL